MANNFFQIKSKKKNRKFLKENGFTQLKSAIYNPESEELLLINTSDREFWTTCHDGIKDISKLIEDPDINPPRELMRYSLFLLSSLKLYKMK